MNWTTFAMCQVVSVTMQHVTVARGATAREDSALAIVPHMAYAAVVGLITPAPFTWLAVAIFAGPYLMNLPLFVYQRRRVRDVLRATLEWRQDAPASVVGSGERPAGEGSDGELPRFYAGESGRGSGRGVAADVEPRKPRKDAGGDS